MGSDWTFWEKWQLGVAGILIAVGAAFMRSGHRIWERLARRKAATGK